MKWPTGEIETAEGKQKCIAPWIVSASRATDLPAYYSQWFIDKIRKGYVKWINPFNRQKPQYISLSNTQVIVFWSKNPKPLIPSLRELDEKKIQYYFQFTLNDYEKEGFEPRVPPLEERLESFQMLSELIGKDKVIWRFDPLLITDRTPPDVLLEKIEKTGEKLHGLTKKLVFSFADISRYKKVQANLKSKGIHYEEFSVETMDYVAGKISELNKAWGLTAATCGEKRDFSKYGIIKNRCIDDELILKITDSSTRTNEFEKFLGFDPQMNLFKQGGGAGSKTEKNLKDKGQRKECGCIYSKDIGSYNTCSHLCVYCYANNSPKAVSSNINQMTVESDALLPF
ncbi:MAG: DUF1848 domain-containing protein [Desulfobacteraceae bacterium]